MSTLSEFESLKPPRLDPLERTSLYDYFVNTWELYELLFSSITGDGALYTKPDPLRQPLIFYLGHTATFYVNKLRMSGVISLGIDEAYEELFAVGVDPTRADELGAATWPSEEAVRGYRRAAFDLIADQIDKADLEGTIDSESPLWSLLMGLEHDRIHFETSSVLIRQYDESIVERPETWTYGPTGGAAAPFQVTTVNGGEVSLGKPREVPTFGWDNEYGHLDVDVADFFVGRHLVTNQAFLEFWREDGYQRRELWCEEGWAWKQGVEARGPRFWVLDAEAPDTPHYRAMFDVLALPAAWPVEVNLLEARAFCRWKGAGWRLPTEAEFARMSRDATTEDDPGLASTHNLDLAYGSPTPVGHMAQDRGSESPTDVHGNVWEWLQNDFYPFPGYEPHDLYPDYSAPFMGADHGMLAGGSWASSGTSASKYYRQWFRRNFYQHAGFRLARDGSRR